MINECLAIGHAKANAKADVVVDVVVDAIELIEQQPRVRHLVAREQGVVCIENG